MGIFKYEDDPAESASDTDPGKSTVSICDNGVDEYKVYRMTVPKDIADEHDITQGDQIVVEPTENGWEATVLDL